MISRKSVPIEQTGTPVTPRPTRDFVTEETALDLLKQAFGWLTDVDPDLYVRARKPGKLGPSRPRDDVVNANQGDQP